MAPNLSLGILSLIDRERPRSVEHLGSLAWGCFTCQCQSRIQPRSPLCYMPVDVPELPQGSRQPYCKRCIGLAERRCKSLPEVRVLQLEAGQHGRSFWSFNLAAEALSHGQVVPGMALPARLFLTMGNQLLKGVLADRLQHREARFVADRLHPHEQAGGHQGTDAGQHIVPVTRDRFRCLERESADEDPEPPEQHLLGLGKQVVAPGDGRPHVALAVRGVRGPPVSRSNRWSSRASKARGGARSSGRRRVRSRAAADPAGRRSHR